ncbi:unnamed protein product [Schistosoma mattheei]|uniref:Uncharacterized protein n=1 Tax=Schistosoma mattheei TaxID=31246 RepID=A0A3P8ASB2_9TREM|nr:unnamed protein product [Schistosoma mattheei]
MPIVAFVSVSDPPGSSMMIPRYVKDSTSSRVLPLSVIVLLGVLRVVFEDLAFSFVLRPTDAKAGATLVVFICICSCVCDRRAR